ncbi:hypothetical protein U1Q18_014512, partial [Sarracenia purpurea var. burkii]
AKAIMSTVKDLEIEANHINDNPHFDLARMAALEARIQRLKGLSPVKIKGRENLMLKKLVRLRLARKGTEED